MDITPPVNTTSDSGNSSNPALIITIIVLAGILLFAILAFIVYAINKNKKSNNNDDFSAPLSSDKPTNISDSNNDLHQLYADRHNAKIESQKQDLNKSQNPAPVQTAPKSGHGFLKFLVAIILIGSLIFGAIKIVDCASNPDNKDGASKLTSRSARYSDVTITQSDEFTLTNKYKLVPHTDIDNLEITIHFSDSSQKLVKTKTKYIGNVVKNGEYTFSFSYSDFSIQEIWKIEYWRYEVTGGTVQYFS